MDWEGGLLLLSPAGSGSISCCFVTLKSSVCCFHVVSSREHVGTELCPVRSTRTAVCRGAGWEERCSSSWIPLVGEAWCNSPSSISVFGSVYYVFKSCPLSPWLCACHVALPLSLLPSCPAFRMSYGQSCFHSFHANICPQGCLL